MIASLDVIARASLDSSDAVLLALSSALKDVEPAIDAVLVFRPDGAELACVFTAGLRAEHFASLRMSRESRSLPTLCGVAGHHVESNGSRDALIPTDRVALAIPMFARNRLEAIVYLSSATCSTFGQRSGLVGLTAHATIPYVIALEREADRASATFDALTGLYTAKAFRERVTLDLEMVMAQRNRSLSLWFIDTDGFKEVNDSLGHAAGDRVLRELADILRACIRGTQEAAGRNGGDEFCALLGAAHKLEALERAARFCETVRRHDFGIPLRITASLGVAAFPQDAASSNELFEIADAAMYHSKRSGRDCTSFSRGAGTFIVYR